MPTTSPATKDDLRSATKDIIEHFNRSQSAQDERVTEQFREVTANLEAIKEMLAMRKELKNLVRELKVHGIAVDESKIFVV